MGIFKIKLNVCDVTSSLNSRKKELEKLSEIKGLNVSLMDKLNFTQFDRLNDLNEDIL